MMSPDITPALLPSYSIQQDTPDGRMFVHISEHNGVPVRVYINIGKAGSNLMAWADATGRMITMMLKHYTVHDIIEELSGITSSKLRLLASGSVCRSGPEGIALALLKYRVQKFKENRPKFKDGRASTGN